jgi:hypothetical protein
VHARRAATRGGQVISAARNRTNAALVARSIAATRAACYNLGHLTYGRRFGSASRLRLRSLEAPCRAN